MGQESDFFRFVNSFFGGVLLLMLALLMVRLVLVCVGGVNHFLGGCYITTFWRFVNHFFGGLLTTFGVVVNTV